MRFGGRRSADVYSRAVGRFLKPVACCVLLLLGGAPAVALVCEWSCTPQTSDALHHGGHDHHSPNTGDAAQATVDIPSDGSSTSVCDHRQGLAPALTIATVKIWAPVALPAALLNWSDFAHSTVIPFTDGVRGPPGGGSRPRPLRI